MYRCCDWNIRVRVHSPSLSRCPQTPQRQRGRQKSPDDRKVLRSLAPNYLGPGLSVHAIRKRKCALPQWVHFCTEPLWEDEICSADTLYIRCAEFLPDNSSALPWTTWSNF